MQPSLLILSEDHFVGKGVSLFLEDLLVFHVIYTSYELFGDFDEKSSFWAFNMTGLCLLLSLKV